MSVSKWTILDESIYRHSPWRSIKDRRFRLPDGREQTYSLKNEGSCVCVLALTLEGRIVLARQYRPGPDLVLDELPGGGVDLDETFEQAARRELLEETGYEAGEMVSLGIAHECGYSTVRREGFLALQCKRIRSLDLDDNEFIEPVEKSVEEFIEQLIGGMCTDPEFGWMGLYKLGKIRTVEKGQRNLASSFYSVPPR